MANVNELIQKMILQAKNGKIEIGDKENGIWSFFINFNMKIEGDFNVNDGGEIVPVFDVPNYDLFVKKVEEYLSVAKEFYKQDQAYFQLSNEAFEEKLFVDLMMNSTFFEQSNVYDFIDYRTELLKNEFPEGEFELGKFGEFSVVGKISKNVSNLEAPYKFEVSFYQLNGGNFTLPSVTFGGVENMIKLYAVQAKKEKQTSPVAKKLDRFFRKVNKDVEADSVEMQVSPNAVASLCVFASWARKNGFKSIEGFDFLPIRYYGNKASKIKRFSPDVIEEELENHDRDQFNMTNKLMYLFLRYGAHFKTANPEYDENKGVFEIQLKEEPEKGDNIVFDLDEFVDVSDYKKFKERFFENKATLMF